MRVILSNHFGLSQSMRRIRFGLSTEAAVGEDVVSEELPEKSI